MPKMLMLVRYTPQGAAGVAKDGLGSRRDVMAKYLESRGGKLIDMWGAASDDWDAVLVFESADTPPERLIADGVQASASGAMERVQRITLVDVEAVDGQIRAGRAEWRAPGT